MALYRLFFLLCILLAGCSQLGISNPFSNDPLTGGTDASSSLLLNIALPSGLQRYESHGFIKDSMAGGKEGVEILRGYINERSAAKFLFNSLAGSGWQLCMYEAGPSRSFYLYKNSKEYAALLFHPQGALTILEIWSGPSLPQGYKLDFSSQGLQDTFNIPSIAPEEFGSSSSSGSIAPKKEIWGKTNLEEREL